MLSQTPFPIETLIDILVADTDRLETVKYAEVGVPMFLVGEDVSGASGKSGFEGEATDCLGEHLTQLAGALGMRKAELDLDDVAKLLEVLADRYFLPLEGEAAARAEVHLPPSAGLRLPPGAPTVLAELVDGLSRARGIRLINFHATPRYREAEFRRQIALYAQLFEPVTPANFAAAVDGSWPHDRPALMPALFEGYRDNLDVLLPILEEYGFTGWFFVPSAFLSVPEHEQRQYAAAHDLFLPELDEYPDDRIALTWEEARAIKRRGHVFACHTRTHNELKPDSPQETLVDEIVTAKAEIDGELGGEIDIFCWLEGAAVGVNAQADAMLRDVGFRYLFSNFKIQKLR